jgi:nucleotide-binding universal stress UspA family protein
MTTVQIFGISESDKTTLLRSNVIQALQEMGTKATVENVSDVDQFIQYNINGIPALVVNGAIVLQKEVPDVEDLKILLKVFDKSSSNLFEMKKILVPTDFSPASVGAYQFAADLAKIQHSQLKIIHVYHPDYDPQNPYLTEPIYAQKEIAETKLKNFAVSHNGEGERTESPVEKELVIGFAVEEIVHSACDQDIELVVMGTTGEKNLLEKLFGSVSTNVAQKAKCPVLLIPNGVQFKGFKHILYASNFESTNEAMLDRLVGLADVFKADIHFVHVMEEGNPKDFKIVENQIFKILFRGGEPSFSFTMSKVEGNTITEGLNDYALQHQIDLAVLVSPQRSFWDSLFHKSVTKSMALNTRLPVMILH